MKILKSYCIATLGLFLISMGVAISLKSNLGTSPISCPPCMMNLKWSGISVGVFTWIVNFSLIFLQIALLRSKFRLWDLMQIPAVLLFGFLCDVSILLCRSLPVEGYGMQVVWCLVAVLLSAVGLRIEINGNAWMLSGDKTCAVMSEVFGWSLSTVKIAFDVAFVIASAAFAILVFNNFFGNGETNVIREGTIILALLTGLCMKITDPVVEKIFKPQK